MTILVQQQLREAAREIANWSGSLTDTWVSSQASYMWIVGCIDEDDQKYPVVRIEADAYGHQGESEKLAEFIRLANPKSVLALLDEIERLSALVIERETVRIGQSLQRHDDQKQIDELVALGIQQDKDEIARLRAENERWRQNYEHLIEQHMPRTGHGCEEGWSRVVEARELQAQVDQLKAQASLQALLPELDEALEDLEIHGRHSDQGYRKLKDWYRKVSIACQKIDKVMTEEQP